MQRADSASTCFDHPWSHSTPETRAGSPELRCHAQRAGCRAQGEGTGRENRERQGASAETGTQRERTERRQAPGQILGDSAP